MPLIFPYYFLFLFVLSTSVFASCTRYDIVLPVDINMELGRVVVDPDLPIGAVIKERTWSMDSETRPWAECDGGTKLDANIIQNKPLLGDNIIETNIPGIGMKFIRESNSGSLKIVYPGHFTVPGEGRKRAILAGSTFTVQIIKTASVTGSGVLNEGEYTRYGYQPNNILPALITRLNGRAITIVSPSCKITSGEKQTVMLPSIYLNQLTSIGSTAAETPFSINMLCSGGVNLENTSNIYITFSGELAPNTQNNQGVLANTLEDYQSAQGVGIQITTDNKNPLEWNKHYPIGTVGIEQEKEIILNYFAKYYQYGKKISPGKVHAKMVFNLTYD